MGRKGRTRKNPMIKSLLILATAGAKSRAIIGNLPDLMAMMVLTTM